MLKLSADLGFFHEPLLAEFPAREFGFEHLECQIAAKAGIATLQDHAHAAASNLTKQLVAFAGHARHLRRTWLHEREIVGWIIAKQGRLRPTSRSRLGSERVGHRGIKIGLEAPRIGVSVNRTQVAA